MNARAGVDTNGMTSRWLLPPLWRMVWAYLARYERPMVAEGLPEIAAVHTPPTTTPSYRGICKDILRRALEDGNLAAIHWAESKGYVLTERALRSRRGTTLEAEEFLLARGFPLTSDSFSTCIRGGDAETLRWLSERKCPGVVKPVCFGSLAVARAFIEMGHKCAVPVALRLTAFKDVDYLRFMSENFTLRHMDNNMRMLAVHLEAPPEVLEWFASKLGPFDSKSVQDAIVQLSFKSLGVILDSKPKTYKNSTRYCDIALSTGRLDKLKLLKKHGYAWFEPCARFDVPPGPELCSWLMEVKDNPMPMSHLCAETVRMASFEAVQLLEKTTGHMHSWLGSMQDKLGLFEIDGYPSFEMAQWLVGRGFSLKETSYVSVAYSYAGHEMLRGWRGLVPPQTKRIPPQPKDVVLYQLDWLKKHKIDLPPQEFIYTFLDLLDWFEAAYAESGTPLSQERLGRRCVARDDVKLAQWLLKRDKKAFDVLELIQNRAWNVLEHFVQSDRSRAKQAYGFCAGRAAVSHRHAEKLSRPLAGAFGSFFDI